jgi:hypothetical protein
MLTGADDLEIGAESRHKGAGGADQGATSSSSGPSTTSAGGATSGPGATSSSTASSTSSGVVDGPDAVGVSISDIAIYQGVKRSLMQPTNTPVVAGRDAMIRVFTQTDGSYNGQPVTARLYLSGSAPMDATHTAGGGKDGSLGSTLNFSVPGAAIQPGTTFHVAIMQNGGNGTQNPGAHYPASGDASLDAKSAGAQLRLRIVPVRYGADGSNRVPDTSPSALKSYADRFLAIYPAPSIDIQVVAPMQWNQTVSADGSGWDTLLNGVTDRRAQDNAPADTYYYGAFDPAGSFGGFCGGGCVAGLGWIAGSGDGSQRAAIGLGYTEVAAETATHEIGHNHGRSHAPCGGAAGTDPGYPYNGASIGVWGYDIVTQQLFNPNQTTDMMGYCNPTWVSDYTFKALFTRIKTLNGAQIQYPPDQLDRRWARARVDMHGDATFMSSITVHEPPVGALQTITLTTENGPKQVTGHFFGYDHLDGGVMWWLDEAPANKVIMTVGGKLVQAVL